MHRTYDVDSVTTDAAVAGAAKPTDTRELTRLARVALIVAAQRRTTLTVRELGLAIGISGVELRPVLHLVLTELAEQCVAEQMPSLPALVINAQTGAPGHGWPSCNAAWFSEAQQVFRRWGGPDRPGLRRAN
jgi:hypothetical protein